MSPAPVRNILGQTLDLLGEAIVSGRYAPSGMIPPEPVLCGELGVSRTVVREAIKSLVAKGLISTGPKVGTRVLPPDNWNWFDHQVVAWQSRVGLTREFMSDVQELRRVLEPAAVRLAAERATASDIADIEEAYRGMKQAIEEGGDFVSHDLNFHLGLLRAGHNRMVVQMGKALGALLRVAFEISNAHADGPASSLPLHRAVLDAIIARDPERAERAALTLIDGARDDMARVMDSRRKLPAVDAPASRMSPVVRMAPRRTSPSGATVALAASQSVGRVVR
jgi:DNA-binding FadR family transcriptional regulator